MGRYVAPLTPVIDWINAQTSLVGKGNPLPGGAHRHQHRSPQAGAYAHITLVGTADDGSEDTARGYLLSASVYGATDPAAEAGAMAVANLWADQDGMPVHLAGCVLRVADGITGPTVAPDSGDQSHRYLVDALVWISPT